MEKERPHAQNGRPMFINQDADIPEEFKRSILSIQVKENEFEQLAKTFAENNDELKKLLLFLWENNIQTWACCGGHYGKIVNNRKFLPSLPYISICFDKTEKNQKMINNFLTELLKYNKKNPMENPFVINAELADFPLDNNKFDLVVRGRLIGPDKYNYPTNLLDENYEKMFFVASNMFKNALKNTNQKAIDFTGYFLRQKQEFSKYIGFEMGRKVEDVFWLYELNSPQDDINESIIEPTKKEFQKEIEENLIEEENIFQM